MLQQFTALGAEGLDVAADDRDQEGLEVGKVAVESAGADTRLLGDFVERGMGALLVERRPCCLQDPVTVVAGVSALWATIVPRTA